MGLQQSSMIGHWTAFLCLALCLLLPSLTRADTIQGADAELYRGAVQTWLDDNDQDSLPKLAGLARDGNAAAKELLWLIGARPDLWTSWLDELPDTERNAFFRPRLVDGRGHGGWWRPTDEPEIVRLLRTEPLEDPFIEDMIRLIEQGEPRLAFTRMASVLRYRDFDQIASIAASSRLPPELHFFMPLAELIRDPAQVRELSSAPPSDGEPDERMQLALFYSWATYLMVESDFAHQIPAETLREMITDLHGVAEHLPFISGDILLADPVHAGKSAWPARRERTLDWLKHADSAAHYRRMCRQSCASEFDRCLLTSFFANNGFAVMYGQDTPSERLISGDDFRKSERGRKLPLRRLTRELLGNEAAMPTRLNLIHRGSACFASEISLEIKRRQETESQ
jgi:hypothetical protein